jgi:hypothetical protein
LRIPLGSEVGPAHLLAVTGVLDFNLTVVGVDVSRVAVLVLNSDPLFLSVSLLSAKALTTSHNNLIN